MVIRDFNVERIAIMKPEANAPLIVYGYGVLTLAIAS